MAKERNKNDSTPSIDRRALLAGSSALGAAALLPSRANAQAASTAAPSMPARGEFVVRGAYVISMDDKVGDFPTGDVHVRDGVIVAVAASVAAPGAQVIDGKGMICMPGFVDTHWHHWTTFLRPVMRADDPKKTYFPVTFALGVHYTPEDSYRAVRLGLAEALSAGVTTTHNWAHNVRSPAHADAEVRAMRESGLRGRFAYGPAQGMPNTQQMDFADMARLKRDIGTDSMLTLGANSRNIDGSNASRGAINADMAKKEWGAARDLGLPITLHTNGSASIQLLKDANLLGPDVQLVHPLNTNAADWELLAKHGVHYSTSPLGEAGRTGEMQFIEMMQAGVLVSMFLTFNANLGVVFTLKALVVVIMGGVGNLLGALIAGLILGLVENYVAVFVDPGLTLAATYAIFLLVLLVRPQGILGRSSR